MRTVHATRRHRARVKKWYSENRTNRTGDYGPAWPVSWSAERLTEAQILQVTVGSSL